MAKPDLNQTPGNQSAQPHAAAQTGIQEWQRIIEAQDWERLPALLTENVVYRNPATFEAYYGKPTLIAILRAVSGVFQGFKYLRQFSNGTGYVLEFSARVGDAELHGVDLVELNHDGKITDLMVMIRPANVALTVAAEATKRLTPQQPSAESTPR
jgi:hypothetical protein